MSISKVSEIRKKLFFDHNLMENLYKRTSLDPFYKAHLSGELHLIFQHLELDDNIIDEINRVISPVVEEIHKSYAKERIIDVFYESLSYGYETIVKTYFDLFSEFKSIKNDPSSLSTVNLDHYYAPDLLFEQDR